MSRTSPFFMPKKEFDLMNSMNEELNQSKQVVRLLVSDLHDAKKRLLQIIGEAMVNGKLDK